MVSELPTMPMRLRLFGHIFFYARDPLRFFERAARVGPLVRVQLAGVRGVMVTEPDLVEATCMRQNRHLD